MQQIERGECSFVSKVIRAQESGAVAVIVTEMNEDNDEFFISMVDDTTKRKAEIPAGYLLGKNGSVERTDFFMDYFGKILEVFGPFLV